MNWCNVSISIYEAHDIQSDERAIRNGNGGMAATLTFFIP